MDDNLKCPKCGSSQTTYRVKTNDRICYKCGCTYGNDLKEEEDGNTRP